MQTEQQKSSPWGKLTLAEQFGNIGSEVSRAYNWEKKGDREQKSKALARALELLDFSLDDKRWDYPKLKELARVREVLASIFIGSDEYKATLESLQNYFLYFGILARANR